MRAAYRRENAVDNATKSKEWTKRDRKWLNHIEEDVRHCLRERSILKTVFVGISLTLHCF